MSRVTFSFKITNSAVYIGRNLRSDLEDFFGASTKSVFYASDESFNLIVEAVAPLRVTAYTVSFDHAQYGIELCGVTIE